MRNIANVLIASFIVLTPVAAMAGKWCDPVEEARANKELRKERIMTANQSGSSVMWLICKLGL